MDLGSKSLKTIFIHYLLAIIVGIVLVLGVLSTCMGLFVGAGIIVPANHDELVAFSLKEMLDGKEVLTEADFKGKCKYALFDSDYTLISSNLEDIEGALAYLKGEGNNKKYYVIVKGQNEYGVIEYKILARYNDSSLEKYLPNVEATYLIVLVVAVVSVVILISSSYGKRLNQALNPLKIAVEHIKEQDLDFKIEGSGIKEFDDIGNSLSHMKTALQESLTKQWELESRKREQMAAIAHDIKTPLTLIKGNAQLLEEDELLEEEQRMMSRSIIRNSSRIQEYVQLLIEVSSEKVHEKLYKEIISIEEFMDEIYEQAVQLGRLNDVSMSLELPKETVVLEIDKSLMSRALLNIVSNGIDYTPTKGNMILKVALHDKHIEIQVLDEGKGFSSQALQAGCQAFYMGDESRNRKGHYGMGLYIARQIITSHEGELRLENREDGKGAKVIIRLPILSSNK